MRSEEQPLILLDTHVLVWLQFGERDRLTNRLWHAVARASDEGNLLLSVFSVWEIGMLESKGRLRLFEPCEDWVRKALSTRGLTLAPLTPEIALESTRIPGSFHGDPADRIIVATTRLMDARLLTRDDKMLEYARQGHVRVV
jgi:PIN domain nuclease of toxin-antitoxin system